jgi:hypothetical protein
MVNDLSEPEPDLTFVHFWPDYYADRLPSGKDLALVIEVADTTFAYNTKIKARLTCSSSCT